MSSYQDLCQRLDEQLTVVVTDGLVSQPDSRALGAHVERAVLDAWPQICSSLGVTPLPFPGRRTIYDAAFEADGSVVGIDVRTKDLDESRYADGGICSVGNLLRFLNDGQATFVVAEFGYREDGDRVNVVYVHSAPLHCIPISQFRIENLGTGQVRLEGSVFDAAGETDWNRTVADFVDEFCTLGIAHYERVANVARTRADSLRAFQESGELRLR